MRARGGQGGGGEGWAEESGPGILESAPRGVPLYLSVGQEGMDEVMSK